MNNEIPENHPFYRLAFSKTKSPDEYEPIRIPKFWKMLQWVIIMIAVTITIVASVAWFAEIIQ